jgi:phage-related protein
VVRTFIFADVFQGERATGIFALDDTNFAEGSFANDPKQTKVVKIHCDQYVSMSETKVEVNCVIIGKEGGAGGT